MKRLRYLATLNPPVGRLGRDNAGDSISFLPLDRVWADDRFDPSEVIEFSGDVQSYNPVAEGDLLIPKVSPTFAHGRTAIARNLEGGRALATSEVFVLRANDPNTACFLQYRLRATDFLSEGRASWSGVAGLKRISADFLRDVRIDSAAWAHQRAIADFLDRECARIDELRDELVRLDAAMASSESDLAARLVGASSSVQLRYRLTGITQGWSPECEAREADAGEWGVLKVGAVNYRRFRPLEHKRLPDGLDPRPSVEVKLGDLLMSRANTKELVGSVAVVDDLAGRRLMMSDKHYRLTCSVDLLPSFAALVLQDRAVRDQIEVAATGASSSMQNISQELVRSLVIPDLSPSEQQTVVDRAGRMIAHQRVALAELEELDKALLEYRDVLITEAVTGKLDVSATSDQRMVDSLAAVAEGEQPEVLS